MRRAFAHLVDRQYIVDTIAQAEQVIADSRKLLYIEQR